MDKTEEHIDKLLKQAQELNNQRQSILNDLYRCNEHRRYAEYEYRILSTSRVLNFILDEYRDGRLVDLDNLLEHCLAKLNGRIDGTELSLDEQGRPVTVLPLELNE